MRRPTLVATVVCCALLLAACGSSTPSATHASARRPKQSASSPGTRSVTPSSSDAPTVAHATDLSVQPVISPDASPSPSKLVVVDLVSGTGAVATTSSTVEVKYVGADYSTGVDFTSSTWTTNRPATFSLRDVVPGFREGIVGMEVGGRREIVIPPSLGYGPTGQPPTIKPNETLVFVVDLVGIK